MTFLVKWTEYAQLRLEAEEAEERAKKAKASMRAAEADLIDAMLEDEIKNWKDSDGCSVTTVRHFGISCTKENAHLIEEWLRDETGDAEQYKKTTLDKSAVEAYLKDQVEERGMPQEDVPAFFNLNTRPGIRVNGWEAKKKTMV